jgi:HD-GYP domain-containing protein (c-di-GMP phosphodiesterase class II)
MHISLAERWWDHPFLLSEFTLEQDAQIAVIAGLEMTHVLWSPTASRCGPREAASAAPVARPGSDLLAATQSQRQTRRTESRQAIDRLRRADREHMHAASAMREALSLARMSPRAAVQKSLGVVTEAAAIFASEENVSVVLLSDRVSGLRMHTHAINVMLLSLLSGRAQRWDEAALGELGLGALFHDVGLLKLPDAIRMKPEAEWTRSEQAFMQEHTSLGAKMMLDIPEFPRAAQAAVAMHHEHWDGSGYPFRLSGENIPAGARHVAVANRYDELCHPHGISGAISPSEALARMYKAEKAHFDPELLTSFIRALGIYPPGTLVELSNGAIGLIAGVNRDQPMRPLVTLWQEQTRKEDAPVVDLTIEPELSVSRALRESELQPEVIEYLSPRSRTAYFYARMQAD